MTVAELTAWIHRLPLDVRAQLAWAPRAFELALMPLLEGDLDDVAIERATVEVFSVLARCFSTTPSLAGPGSLGFRAVEQDVLKMLHSHLNPAAADAAEWVFRAINAMGELASSMVPAADRARVAKSADSLTSTVHDPIRGGLMRAEVMVMAILHAIAGDRPVDTTRVEDLVDWAMVDASTFVNFVKGAGLQLQLFPEESRDEALLRQRRYVDHVRAVYTDEVVDAVAAARVHRLR